MEYDIKIEKKCITKKERCNLKDYYTMGSIPVKDAFGVVYSPCREPDRFDIPRVVVCRNDQYTSMEDFLPLG